MLSAGSLRRRRSCWRRSLSVPRRRERKRYAVLLCASRHAVVSGCIAGPSAHQPGMCMTTSKHGSFCKLSLSQLSSQLTKSASSCLHNSQTKKLQNLLAGTDKILDTAHGHAFCRHNQDAACLSSLSNTGSRFCCHTKYAACLSSLCYTGNPVGYHTKYAACLSSLSNTG